MLVTGHKQEVYYSEKCIMTQRGLFIIEVRNKIRLMYAHKGETCACSTARFIILLSGHMQVPSPIVMKNNIFYLCIVRIIIVMKIHDNHYISTQMHVCI